MESSIVIEDLKYIIDSALPWNEFEGKTVLVAGANGFLPTYIIKTLLYLNKINNHQKTKVIALSRNDERAKTRFIDYLDSEHFELIIQDVCDPINLKQHIDYIIHAASQASPKYYKIDPVGTLNANVLGTNNLLQLASRNNVIGFLYFSSGEVYGEVSENNIPTKEHDFGYIDPTNLRSCYSESKRLGETMCISWFHQYGVPVKIVRPFHTYGPGMSLDDGRVFADFVADIVNRRNIVMKSDGSAIRAFCYLSDATIGFFTVLLKGKNGEAYNVGNSNEEVSILGLADILINLYPEESLKVIRQEGNSNIYLKSSITRNCPDVSKVNSLGWKPKIKIAEGFKKTIDSFLNKM